MIYPWQQKQWQSFSQQKLQQRLPHAMILTGISGLGKLSFAKQVAASVLCIDSANAMPCGQCHSCQLFEAESHPDHTFIEPEETGKQIKIEQIRRLKDKQELTHTVSKWKTVIISPADSMNISSNNSLLKLLEEPQENTLLLLITAQAEKLPITILSRCQQLAFTAPEYAVAADFIQQHSPSIDKKHSDRLLSLAKGAPLGAIAMQETDVYEHIQVIEQDFESILNGQANPVELAKNWQAHDLLLSFNHLQNIIQQRLIAEQATLNASQTRYYWHIYDCIIAAIKLTSSSNNINKILLIEQFIVSVMDKNWNKQTGII